MNGLNIFLAQKISALPEDLRNYFEASDQQKTVCLLGNGGSQLWTELDHSQSDPFDQFTINEMKKIKDSKILYPGLDNFPLQKLSQAMGFSAPSVLGIDICEDYGLWFAFRGVFVTEETLPLTVFKKPVELCQTCLKPCLSDPDFHQARLLCPVKTEHTYSENQQRYHEAQALKLKNSR